MVGFLRRKKITLERFFGLLKERPCDENMKIWVHGQIDFSKNATLLCSYADFDFFKRIEGQCPKINVTAFMYLKKNEAHLVQHFMR